MKDDRTTMAELVRAAMKQNGEQWADIVHISVENEADLFKLIDEGYGATEGPDFTIWTDQYVYFPAQHDGAEWVESVPRNPCDKITEHVGGGGA